jgi:hypothetical protein
MTINFLAKFTLLAEQARRSGKRSGTAKTEAKQQEHVVACRNQETNKLFYYMFVVAWHGVWYLLENEHKINRLE